MAYSPFDISTMMANRAQQGMMQPAVMDYAINNARQAAPTPTPQQKEPPTKAATQPAPTKPALQNLGNILRVQDPSQADPDTLAALRKYDPNAQYVYDAPEQSSEGGINHTGGYRLQFDPSKLPGAFGSNESIGAHYNKTLDPSNRGEEWQGPTFDRVSPNDKQNIVKDWSKVYKDPVYGVISPFGNMYRPQEKTWLDWAGPMMVGGFGALMGGAGFLPSLLQKAPGYASKLANGQNPFGMGDINTAIKLANMAGG